MGRDLIKLSAKITRGIVDTRPSFRGKSEHWDSDDGPPPDIDEILITSELLGLSYDIEVRPDRTVAVSNVKWAPRKPLSDPDEDVSVSQLMSDKLIASSLEKELESLPLGRHKESSKWKEGSIDWEMVSVADGVARLDSTIKSPGDGPVLKGKLEFDLARRRPIRYAVGAEIVTESSRGKLTIVIEELTTYAIR